jgi:hypothetical protein
MTFFADLPLPVQFFLAFVIIFELIIATVWAASTAARFAAHGAARESGLAVVDYASIDRTPMCRDHVNHLVMIGGPTNIMVESIAAPSLSAPRAVRANVAESKPSHDETKQVMARRARM